MGKSTSWAPLKGELSRRPSAVTEGYKPSRFRSFLSRLRMAWKVLIGKAAILSPPPKEAAQSAPLPKGGCPEGTGGYAVSSMSPLRLRSSWWAHGPDLTHARDMVRRELCDAAAPYILYQDLPTEDGGYQVTGELHIYAKGKEEGYAL